MFLSGKSGEHNDHISDKSVHCSTELIGLMSRDRFVGSQSSH